MRLLSSKVSAFGAITRDEVPNIVSDSVELRGARGLSRHGAVTYSLVPLGPILNLICLPGLLTITVGA